MGERVREFSVHGHYLYVMSPSSAAVLAPASFIETHIFSVRDQKVMMDSDLATLYGVTTKRLNESVKRNKARFPKDFMFRLRRHEVANLRSQIATSSYGGRRYLPYAFTEHGVAMLSSVLSSKRAIQMNINIMRTFIKLRQAIVTQQDLGLKIDSLRSRVDGHDADLQAINEALNAFVAYEENPPKRRIGFPTP